MVTTKRIILFSIFYFLFSAQTAFASQIFFEQRGPVVDVLLNTQGQNINAFEGTITADGTELSVSNIQNAGSVINFWIKKPEPSDGGVVFAGITPGGFSGAHGLLFSFGFEPKPASDVYLNAKNLTLLKNDGLGTADNATVAPFTAHTESGVLPPWYQNVLIWVIIIITLLFSAVMVWLRKHI